MAKRRASSAGVGLDESDAPMVKGMLARGDRQHDVAAWFGVNGGRIAEIATGAKFWWVDPAEESELPPPGPYLGEREARVAADALAQARRTIDEAERLLRSHMRRR